MPISEGRVIRRSERALVVRSWEHRAVVFDCSSGDTLFLAEAPSMVLNLLSESPASEAVLVARANEHYDDPAGDLATAVRHAIEELDKLGFISHYSA